MNKIIYNAVCCGILPFTALVSCESQESQLIRESQLQQDSIRDAYYEDSLKEVRISKMMRDGNMDRNEATKNVNEIYYKY